MDDVLYSDFRIRPKRGFGRRRVVGNSRGDRRQAYLSMRSEKKEQDHQRREAKTLRLGNKGAKGQRARTCRPGRGKRGWLLMCAAEEVETRLDDGSIDIVSMYFQTEEHCADRWDAAVLNAKESSKSYPAREIRFFNMLSSPQYRKPANLCNANRIYGPVQRLPAIQIVRPSSYASDLTSRIMCPICCTNRAGLVAGCASSCHVACVHCWSRWVCGQADRMRLQRRMGSFGCLGEGCHEILDRRVCELVCPDVPRLRDGLHRRDVLQQNVLYPKCVQVDCPIPGCMGLGYLGHDTVMCFICEHQWPAENGTKPSDVIDSLSNTKACPRCGEYIEKNGGCDHMTCRCGYQFWWSTLNPY